MYAKRGRVLQLRAAANNLITNYAANVILHLFTTKNQVEGSAHLGCCPAGNRMSQSRRPLDSQDIAALRYSAELFKCSILLHPNHFSCIIKGLLLLILITENIKNPFHISFYIFYMTRVLPIFYDYERNYFYF